MSILTLNYKQKERVTPVLDQLTKDSESSGTCSSVMEITVNPTGTKYLELVFNDAYGSSNETSREITSSTAVTLTILAFKSFSLSQNSIESSVKVNVRDGLGGTIEDSIILYRDHTENIC